jgi:hypothetical protein
MQDIERLAQLSNGDLTFVIQQVKDGKSLDDVLESAGKTSETLPQSA